MSDYRLLYEDLLAMEHRAYAEVELRGLSGTGDILRFAESCRQFRLDLLMRFFSPVGRVYL